MKRLTITSVCILAAACTAPANPPSLLPRAIEKRAEAVILPPRVEVPKSVDPALPAKINALLVDARAGEADFGKTLASGRMALASGRTASAGSEAWITAEIVLSALQVARQRSASALSEIDTLAINQGELASRDSTVGGLLEIQTAQTEIETIVARQTSILDALNR
jgi:hypothetical protein